MDGSPRTLVTKSDLARRLDRSAARVSQWIKGGQLHGDALVPTPQGERIDLNVAMAQLRGVLDIAQQAAQASPILPLEEPANAVRPNDQPAAGRQAAPVNEDQQRILASKATSAEIAAQRAHREEMAEIGQWVARSDVERIWMRGLTGLMSRIESEFLTMGTHIAAALGTDVRKTTIALRHSFHELRRKIAAEQSARRDELAPLVDLPIGDDMEAANPARPDPAREEAQPPGA